MPALDVLVFAGVSVGTLSLLLLARAKRHTFFAGSSFADKVAALTGAGARHLQIVLDFDRTITTGESESAYGIVEENASEEVRSAARALFNTYYPIETCPHRTDVEKMPHMIQWYERAHALFLGKISRDGIAASCRAARLSFRGEFFRIVEIAERNKIPVVIFSAGIANVIEELLRQNLPGGIIPACIHVCANRMIFDDKGVLSGWDADLIHM